MNYNNNNFKGTKLLEIIYQIIDIVKVKNLYIRLKDNYRIIFIYQKSESIIELYLKL